MSFWEELEIKVNIYISSRKSYDMDDIILCSSKYLKTCAHNSRKKAENLGVYIPFEDFYSEYLLSFWQGIETFLDSTNLSLKNIILRRLFIAEKKVWRLYKKKTKTEWDKNGVSYASARWEELNNEKVTKKTYNQFTDYMLIMNDDFRNFANEKQENSQLISLLLFGYSPSETIKIMGISDNYDTASRKKIERAKKSFERYLNLNKYSIFM